MKILLAILILLIGVGVVAVSQSAFIVRQTEQAIVTQFGKPIDVINAYKKDKSGAVENDAGLYWKIPFVQSVLFYDKRILDLDFPPQELITQGQKRLVVDSFARFQIVDPLLFYQAVRTEAQARNRLGTVLGSSLRRVLGEATFEDIVRDKRSELMHSILKEVNHDAEDFGIRIIDVRIKRADLPEANGEAVYNRMVKEREQEAAGIRAEGAAAANRIRATADRQATIILAEATKTSDEMRGEGEAERTKIFAQVFNKDPEFFAFYRSMKAYEEGLGKGDTRMLISPNSEFFRYFNDPMGAKP